MSKAAPFGIYAADFTGNWASAPIYLVLKQDGNKLSGTGGPSAKDQQLSFDNGTVDGDRATLSAAREMLIVSATTRNDRRQSMSKFTSAPIIGKYDTDHRYYSFFLFRAGR